MTYLSEILCNAHPHNPGPDNTDKGFVQCCTSFKKTLTHRSELQASVSYTFYKLLRLLLVQLFYLFDEQRFYGESEFGHRGRFKERCQPYIYRKGAAQTRDQLHAHQGVSS